MKDKTGIFSRKGSGILRFIFGMEGVRVFGTLEHCSIFILVFGCSLKVP